jgi:uncharacterized membrane protein YkvA (DUF1232 family)
MSLVAELKARARKLKSEVLALYVAVRHPRTPWYAKLLIVAIVAYALSPIDLIPDFIPVLGLLDEIILLPFAIAWAIRLIPPDVMDECRARAPAMSGEAQRMGRAGAIGIVLLWLIAAALAAIWARNAFADAFA